MSGGIYDLTFTIKGIQTNDLKGLGIETARIHKVIEAVLNSAPDDAVESYWCIINAIKEVDA